MVSSTAASAPSRPTAAATKERSRTPRSRRRRSAREAIRDLFFFFHVLSICFFSLFLVVSFIYLFCDINIQVPEMDEEARLASELKKLEKEQERKKKELELVEKRKKDQHAKAASRHISICFVIVFFLQFILFSNCLFFSFPSVCKCMRFLKS